MTNEKKNQTHTQGLEKPSIMKNNSPENQQVIYMMTPHNIDEEEIKIWQLLLPLIKYKVQILFVIAMGIIAGVSIPLIWGETKYSDSLIFQHSRKNNASNESIESGLAFIPEVDLFKPDELILAKDLLIRYWNVPDVDSGYQLYKILDNLSVIQFDEDTFFKDAVRLTVSSDDPLKTINALKDLQEYFVKRNIEKIVEQNTIALNSLARSKQALYQSLITAIEQTDGIKYSKSGSTAYFYIKHTKYFYIIEIANNQWRAAKIASTEIARKTWQQDIKRITAITKDSPTLGEQLQQTYQTYSNLSDKLLINTIDKETSLKIITFLENSKLKKKNSKQRQNIDKNIEKQEKKLKSLTKEIASLQISLSNLSTNAIKIKKALKEVLYFKMQLAELPENIWINFSSGIVDKKSTDSLGDQSIANSLKGLQQNISKVNLPNIELYEQDLKEISDEILELSVMNTLHRSGYVESIQIVRLPSFETIKREFSINFQKNKDRSNIVTKLEKDDVKPIKKSRKILLISVVTATFLAVLSVFIRVAIVRERNSIDFANKRNDLFEALKFWKL